MTRITRRVFFFLGGGHFSFDFREIVCWDWGSRGLGLKQFGNMALRRIHE